MTPILEVRWSPRDTLQQAVDRANRFAREVAGVLNRQFGTDRIEDGAVTTEKLAPVPALCMYATAAQNIANNTVTVVQLFSEEYMAGTPLSPLWVQGSHSMRIRRNGLYRLTGRVGYPLSAAVSANTRISSSVQVNGVTIAQQSIPATSNVFTVSITTTTKKLIQGDMVSLATFQNTGSTQPTIVGASTRPELVVEYVGGI